MFEAPISAYPGCSYLISVAGIPRSASQWTPSPFSSVLHAWESQGMAEVLLLCLVGLVLQEKSRGERSGPACRNLPGRSFGDRAVKRSRSTRVRAEPSKNIRAGCWDKATKPHRCMALGSHRTWGIMLRSLAQGEGKPLHLAPWLRQHRAAGEFFSPKALNRVRKRAGKKHKCCAEVFDDC